MIARAALVCSLLVCLGGAFPGLARAELDLSAEEVKHRLRHRLDGKHFSARIRFEIRKPDYTEDRELDVWRDDEDSARERLMARFDAPSDLRGTGLLYIEGTDGPNDYFLYQPAARRVRRISETLVSQDVYGVDLEYMGFGIAQLQPVDLESMEVVSLDDRPVYRLTERARHRDNQRFDRRILWIDPKTFIPLRTEHIRDGRTTLVATTLVLEEMGGIPTPSETRYERPLDESVVHMRVKRVDYQSPIPEIFFSTLQLTKAH